MPRDKPRYNIFSAFSNQSKKTGTVQEAAKLKVDQAPDYHAGQLEECISRIEALNELVSLLYGALDDKGLINKRLARQIAPYSWELSE